jgi:hypothetical protein
VIERERENVAIEGKFILKLWILYDILQLQKQVLHGKGIRKRSVGGYVIVIRGAGW